MKSLHAHAQRADYLPFNVGAALVPRPRPNRLAERILGERDTLLFLYYTGARIQEALGLRGRDLQGDPTTRLVAALHGKGAEHGTWPSPPLARPRSGHCSHRIPTVISFAPARAVP